MKIWKVKFGMSGGTVDDTWFVRAEDFAAAAKKAVKTGNRMEEAYTSIRDVVSLELQGNEEE